jgi:murein DD-endopeptidase MepM/ murein hydrolase activator NlpD
VNRSGWLVFLVLLLLGAGAAGLWIRAEGTPPLVGAPESVLVGRRGESVSLALSDRGSGLRELRVTVSRADGEAALLEETYPGNLLTGGTRSLHSVELRLDPDRLGQLRGEAMLRVVLRDWSWRGLFSGNETRIDVPLTVDLEPPRVSVETGLTYVKQGGAGAVAYRVSEPSARDGVQVGERFYHGFPMPGGGPGERIALFAVPAEAAPDVALSVIARDAAGNQGSADWPVVVKPRLMPEGNVTLGRGFLENVVPRLSGSGQGDAAAFHDVNTRLRAQNEARIRELLAESAEPAPLFNGRLGQLRNSQVTSRFAERRTYFVEGRAVSKAVHYGYDLAATAATDIEAAAPGRVVYAGDLGIYGRCVLVDHGIGLATLYGHLSQIDVKAGDRVDQGARLGLSGATGLAGGDHLHFAVLVGDTYVDPLEWWDPKWVQTHVTARLAKPAP